MAWLFVPYLSAPESGGLTLVSSSHCLQLELFVTSSGKPSARRLSWRGWAKRPWIALLCGTISNPSMADAGVAKWISSLPASRVSRSRPPREGEGLQKISGPMSSQSSSSVHRRSSFVKTCNDTRSNKRRLSSLSAGTRSPTIPSTAPSWVPHTLDDGGGYLPTLTTRDNQHSPSMMKWPAYRRLAKLTNGQMAPAEFWEWMFGLPIGWTDFELSVTGLSRLKRLSPFDLSRRAS